MPDSPLRQNYQGLELEIVPILDDNYAYILCSDDGAVAVIDPGDAAPILARLKERAWNPGLVINTHAHGDHIAGNSEIIAHSGAELAVPALCGIKGARKLLSGGDLITLGSQTLTILDTPGHCAHHISLWVQPAGILFCGDALFSLGCGRMFSGPAQTLFESLKRLARLPAQTDIYCGHEYTATNGRFAQSVDPENAALAKRCQEVADLRARGHPTLPISLASEAACNPFLRADRREIAENLGMKDADPLEVFTQLRRRRDHFR